MGERSLFHFNLRLRDARDHVFIFLTSASSDPNTVPGT